MKKVQRNQGKMIVTSSLNEYFEDIFENEDRFSGIDYTYDYYRDGSICLYEYYSAKCKCDFCVMVRHVSRETLLYIMKHNREAVSRLSDVFFTEYFK